MSRLRRLAARRTCQRSKPKPGKTLSSSFVGEWSDVSPRQTVQVVNVYYSRKGEYVETPTQWSIVDENLIQERE